MIFEDLCRSDSSFDNIATATNLLVFANKYKVSYDNSVPRFQDVMHSLIWTKNEAGTSGISISIPPCHITIYQTVYQILLRHNK